MKIRNHRLTEEEAIASLRVKMEKWSIPEPNTGCWLWFGAPLGPPLKGMRYGAVSHRSRKIKATHAAWFLEHGEWPDRYVCHRCDMPPCVNPDHLFLGTHAENIADMMAKGRHVSSRGERHGMARLTPEQVRKIRARCAAGECEHMMAAEFGVTRSLIQKIKHRVLWKHLT